MGEVVVTGKWTETWIEEQVWAGRVVEGVCWEDVVLVVDNLRIQARCHSHLLIAQARR